LTPGARNSAGGVTIFIRGLAAQFGDTSLGVGAAGRPLHVSASRPSYLTDYFMNRSNYTNVNVPDAALCNDTEQSSPVSSSLPSAMVNNAIQCAASFLSYMPCSSQSLVQCLHYFLRSFTVYKVCSYMLGDIVGHVITTRENLSRFVETILYLLKYMYPVTQLYIHIYASHFCLRACHAIFSGSFSYGSRFYRIYLFTLKYKRVYVVLPYDLHCGSTRPGNRRTNLRAARVRLIGWGFPLLMEALGFH
jgi:hypothetical protein